MNEFKKVAIHEGEQIKQEKMKEGIHGIEPTDKK